MGMDYLIYQEIDMLCGTGIAKEVTVWLYNMFVFIEDALKKGGVAASSIKALEAVACALLVVYFIVDLINQTSRDMLSLDRLILAFVKLVVAFAIITQLRTILTIFIAIGKQLFLWAATDDFTSSARNKNFFFYDKSYKGKMPTYKTCSDNDWLSAYTGFSGLVSGFGVAIFMLIPYIIGLVAKFVCYFVATSSAVALILRMMFTPLAIVQLFEGGTSSPGVRYLKSLAAEALAFAIMVGVLRVSAWIGQQISAQALEAAFEKKGMGLSKNNFGVIATDGNSNVGSIFTVPTCVKLALPNLVAIGGMATLGKSLAKEIVG